MTKKLPAFVLLTSLGAAVAFSWGSPQPAHAEDYCAKFAKYPKIKDACSKGANDEGKMRDQMKDWQKAVKAKGGDFKCTTCHVKGKGGELKPEGDAKWKEFEKLL
jgi:hypothetical protein